jgi:transposase-like protein
MTREIRNKSILIRVNEEEHARITAKAKEAGLSVSALMRDHVGKLWIKHRTDEAHRVMVLNRINANLNVIAKWANTHQSRAHSTPLMKRLVTIESMIESLIKRLEGK